MIKTLLLDRVLQAMLAIVVLLLIFDAQQAASSSLATLTSLIQMLPYFALAIAIAAYANASSADTLIARAFSGNPRRTVVMAAMVGAISPFCSCGVIPLIAAMLGAGVPLAPVMAFWIASPIMDPEMFILTSAGIGFNFAIAKTLAAVAMGLFSGFAVLGLQKYGWLANPLQAGIAGGCSSSCAPTATAEVKWKFWQERQRVQKFNAEAAKIGIFLGKWLTLAFLLESLMLAYVSSDWIVAYVGSENPFAIEWLRCDPIDIGPA